MRRRAAIGLEYLAAVLVGAALAAAYVGPLRFEFGTILFSVRNLTRPLIAATVVVALRIWLLRVGSTFWARDAMPAVARVMAGALIVAAVLGWTTYLSETVGGADSYGYVSASQRLLRGSLIEEEPFAAILPFENSIAAASPLGYVGSASMPHASVPAYPLGLPALMAMATLIFGPRGAFFVAPLMGMVLVAGGYVVAWLWFRDRLVALAAAALLATQPLVFTYSIQPMSDVPATAFFILAIAWLSTDPRHAFDAGAAAAAALLIRPALAPAAALLALLPVMVDGRDAWRSSARFAVPLAIAVAILAALQQYLYGNPFASGYGSVAALFSSDRLMVNLRSYGYWAFAAFGAAIIGASAVGLAVSPRIARIAVLLVTIGVAGPYMIYRTYDHWETLRFLLPAVALATISAAAGIVFISRRVAGEYAGALVAVTLVFAIAGTWVQWLATQNVFTMPEHEARHRLAGELVARTTSSDAVVLALQHSGSLRYYAARDTVNWDQIPAGALRDTVAALQRHGKRVYLILDSDTERAQFRDRHGSIVDDDGWLPVGQRRDVQLYEAPTPK